jgi:hypothetical protein
LPTAAIRLQRDALLAYGRWPEDDPNEHAVLTASRLLDDVAEHVRHTMWQAMRAAQGESPATSPSPNNGLVHAGDNSPAGPPGMTPNEAHAASALMSSRRRPLSADPCVLTTRETAWPRRQRDAR